ncbi:ABC transporter permease [Chryseolinea sp. T2]|uniref:ABC transporter permease n=1 Tax=Chryseolinea sp. T2 TaxID=3129255 RepID=UPI0030788C4D
MYFNHLITAWRGLLRNLTFSLINVAGLTLGLLCAILIGLWIVDEEQINQFHKDIDRIFIVKSIEYSGEEVNGSYDTPGLLGDELPKVFPEVEYATSYGWTQYHTFAAGEKKLRMPGNFAGNDFFKVFSYPLLVGKVNNLLSTPESIVISRKMAITFFGSPEAALDQTLKFETYKDLKITGVFEDLDSRSSEQFEYIINWQLMVERNSWLKDWGNSGPTTFVKLKAGADQALVQGKIREMIKNYTSGYTKLERLELGLQPFGDMYLHGNFKNGQIDGGKIEYVNLFKLVAVFVLVLACVNFMNLSTARSMKRAREIGVRKSVGAMRSSLVIQFMMEAWMYTSIAVAFALVLLTALLPSFNLLTGKSIESPLGDAAFWISIVSITAVTTIVSGLYPAFVISAFRPAVVLKKVVQHSGSSSTMIRKGLVVFQFSLSIAFIVAMIVISRQVDYIYSKNIGYERSNLIYVPISGEMAQRFETYKQELLRKPGILQVTKMSYRPVGIGNSTGSVEWEGKDPATRPTFTQVEVGLDFVKTTGSELVMGRDFTDSPGDSASYIINETALKVLGYKDPIGMPLKFWDVNGKIIGVVKDFHFASLHVAIDPLVIRSGQGTMWGWTLVRVDPRKTGEALKAMEALQPVFSPDTPFTHQFADEEYSELYGSERLVKQLSRYFAALAIFISCLGLLGSIIFTAEQRTRELSIRKILGATVSQVVTLLSFDFVKLVAIACFFAFPVGYFVVEQWLSNFQYRIGVEAWVFIAAGGGALLVALATISVHAVRTALANPVDALKSE